MRTFRFFTIATTAAAAFIVLAGPAPAATVAECQGTIAKLQTDVASATLFGQQAEKNRASLSDKLTEASDKLAAAKFTDAIQKLGDFTAKVDQLVAGGKIAPESAALLQSDAAIAVACIQSLTG